MKVRKLYDYDSNVLDYTRKDGTRYYLELRGNVTVVDGDSGTGKTLLITELGNLKESGEILTGEDVSKIVIFKSDMDIFADIF